MIKEHMAHLEDIMDATSVGELLNAIAEICGEKGEHIARGWPSASLAKLWDKRARILERIANAAPFAE